MLVQPHTTSSSHFANVLKNHEASLLDEWISAQIAMMGRRSDTIRSADHRKVCSDFLQHLSRASQSGNLTDHEKPEWESVRAFLSSLSRTWTVQNFTTTETATFVLSFKQPLFARLRKEISGEELADEYWVSTIVLDKLGLYTTEVYQKAREDVISRQQLDLLELSTPVVQLWKGIVALPLIGTLDSNRTQVVMESLLQALVQTSSRVAIIDITGVPMVDTLVAQHLIKTITAARLMGAECILSGIRPQIAQTIVHLGVDLGNIVTKASLADALAVALQRSGLKVIQAAN